MIGVLEHVGEIGDIARISGARFRLARPIEGLQDLARLACKLHVEQLWIHPSWSLAHADLSFCGACVEPRDADGRRRRHRHWLPLDRQGPGVIEEEGAAALSLAPTIAIVYGDPNLPRAFGETVDGGELLALVERVAYLLGEAWHGTGGATGTALLRRGLRRAGRQLEPLPLELRRLAGVEPDFGWQRPLTPDEAARRWLYCFDRHQQYLVAAQTVQLGEGLPEFRAHPTFTARMPAYWHCQLAPWPADHPLPDPTRAAGPPRDRGALRWLTTPSVEAALAAGVLQDIAACWYWPVHGAYLQTTAKQIRLAIEVVSSRAARGERSAELTRAVLKSVYAELLSGYLARAALADSDDPLYRPDWRDMVKAEARCRLWYSLRALVPAGCPPVAIATDAIYIPSDLDAPGDVLGGLLRLGARPAEWAYKGRVKLADVREHFTDRVESCRGLVAAVRVLEARS